MPSAQMTNEYHVPVGYALSTGQMVWVRWVTGTATSTTNYTIPMTAGSYGNIVWAAWNEAPSTATTYRTLPAFVYDPPKPTPEQIEAANKALAEFEEAAKKRQEEAVKAEAERRRKEEEADKRAEALLLSCLNEEQKGEYKQDKSFCVRSRTGRRYRIRRAWAGHVTRLDDAGKPVERLCIHPRETVPLPDNQLFAKLMLEADPERLHAVANSTPLN